MYWEKEKKRGEKEGKRKEKKKKGKRKKKRKKKRIKEKEKERKGEKGWGKQSEIKKKHGGVSSDSVYFKSLDFPWNLSV